MEPLFFFSHLRVTGRNVWGRAASSLQAKSHIVFGQMWRWIFYIYIFLKYQREKYNNHPQQQTNVNKKYKTQLL